MGLDLIRKARLTPINTSQETEAAEPVELAAWHRIHTDQRWPTLTPRPWT